MKTILQLTIFTLLFSLKVSAQIPNPGFELLDSNNNSINWGFGGSIAVLLCDSNASDGPSFALSTNAHSGNYAMEIRNSHCYDTVTPADYGIAGYFMSEHVDTIGFVNIVGNNPINFFPGTIGFYYLYTQKIGNDTGSCVLKIYDSINNIVGHATIKLWSLNSMYALASANIIYDSGTLGIKPDHFTLGFSNGNNAHLGTRLLIDDVSFGTPMNINSNPKNSSMSVFPNPANSELNIRFLENYNNVQVVIVDALGRKLYSDNISGMLNHKIDIAGYSSGSYIIKFSSHQLNGIYKFVKE